MIQNLAHILEWDNIRQDSDISLMEDTIGIELPMPAYKRIILGEDIPKTSPPKLSTPSDPKISQDSLDLAQYSTKGINNPIKDINNSTESIKLPKDLKEAFKGFDVKIYDIPQLHHGKRKKTTTIILHRTEGYGYHPEDPRIRKKGIGAHITIDRKGRIHIVKGLDDKFYHAGKYNSEAIGIELTGRYKGKGRWDKLTEAQKRALVRVVQYLKSRYPTISNAYYHAQIAAKSPNEGREALEYLKSQGVI